MKTISTFFLFAIFLVLSQSSFSQIARWRQLNDFPGGARSGAFSFVINNKIYLGGGVINGAVQKDFWEYDISTAVWTRKADFGGGVRSYAVGFSVSGYGYAGTGSTDNAGTQPTRDFWQYNPATNKWTRKADFGGGVREQAFAAATATKGYIGTGLSSKDITSLKKDFWEYTPATNQWRKRGNLGFIPRFGATAFTLNGSIYAGTGINQFAQAVKDFYQYNATRNRWTKKAPYGGTGVYNAVGFFIKSTGYIGCGVDDNKNYHNDFWSYSPSNNKWSKAQSLPGVGRTSAAGASANNSGYVLTGFNNGKYLADVWDLEQVVTPATSSVIADNQKTVAAPATTKPVSIYPNPATSQFTLSMNKGNGLAPTTILIYNMQGNIALRYDLGTISSNFTKTINVASLTNGVYKVIIERGTTRETLSLLVAR